MERLSPSQTTWGHRQSAAPLPGQGFGDLGELLVELGRFLGPMRISTCSAPAPAYSRSLAATSSRLPAICTWIFSTKSSGTP